MEDQINAWKTFQGVNDTKRLWDKGIDGIVARYDVPSAEGVRKMYLRKRREDEVKWAHSTPIEGNSSNEFHLGSSSSTGCESMLQISSKDLWEGHVMCS